MLPGQPYPYHTPERTPPGFGSGFLYGLTGYKDDEAAHEAGWGRLVGEITGYIAIGGLQAAGAKFPPAQVLATKLKGLKVAKPIIGAKRTLDLWASPRGRKVLERIGYSPGRAAELSRQASTDLGIEMLFQGGKLGIGYGSGTEDGSLALKSAELAGILGVTPLGTLGGDKLLRGGKQLIGKLRTPKQVYDMNEEGIIWDGPAVTFPNEPLKKEFVRRQIDWIIDRANGILRHSNIAAARHQFAEPASVKGGEMPELGPEYLAAETKELAQPDSVARRLRRVFVGRSSNLRADMNEALRQGIFTKQEAYNLLREYNIQMNSVSTLDWKFAKIHEDVWETLPREQWRHFDKYNLLRTTKAAIERRQQLLGNAYESNPLRSMYSDLENINQQIAEIEEAAPHIKHASDKLFGSIRREITDEYHKLGMIGDEDLAKLQTDYLPREFLHIYDRNINSMSSMREIIMDDNVNKWIAGVRAIGEGTEELQAVNSRKLLRHALGHAQKEAQEQRISLELLKATERDPSNKLVQKGREIFDIETGQTKWVSPDPENLQAARSVFIKDPATGEAREMKLFLNRELAKDLNDVDPWLPLNAARAVRHLSGSTLIKKFAVELNPLFGAVVNPILDGLSQYMADVKGHRSAFLPKWSMQMFDDIRAVHKEIRDKKGPLLDAFSRHGGPVRGMISHEARGVTPGSWKQWMLKKEFEHREKGWLRELEDWFGAPTQMSELGMRLAFFRRNLLNKANEMGTSVEKLLNDEEIVRNAVHETIDYLNFADDAQAVRFVDSWRPFLQAQANVLKPQIRSVINHPQLYGTKAAQLFALSAGLTGWNKMIGGDEYENISSHAKANNFIVFTPFSTMENGKIRRYYLQLPKDTASAPLTMLPEAIVKRALFGEFPTDEVIDSFSSYGGVSPVHVPTSAQKRWEILNMRGLIPPTAQAWFAYFSNKDVWYNEDVWSQFKDVAPEQEVRSTTSALAQDVAPMFGGSPERLERAFGKLFTNQNPVLRAAGWQYRALHDIMAETNVEKMALAKDLVESTSKRILKKTPAYDAEVFDIPRETSKRISVSRAENNQAMFNILRGIKEGSHDRKDLNKFLHMHGPEERKRLTRQMKFYGKTDNLMHFHLLKSVALVPPQQRAETTFKVYMQLPEKQRAQFIKEVGMYPGLVTRDNFWHKFNLLESQATGRGLLISA